MAETFDPTPLFARVRGLNSNSMSRAFVKEDDDAVEDLPARPVSAAPNLVTATGLAAIEAEVTRLSQELAGVGEDRGARARIARDLRYWRRGAATPNLFRRPQIARLFASAALSLSNATTAARRLSASSAKTRQRPKAAHFRMYRR